MCGSSTPMFECPKINIFSHSMLPDSPSSYLYEENRNNLSTNFHYVDLIQHKNSHTGFLSVVRRFKEISSLMYDMIPPPFESWSSLYSGLKPRIKKFPIGKLFMYCSFGDHLNVYIMSILFRKEFKFISNRFNVEISKNQFV